MVEWNCQLFFSFSSVVFLLVPVLFACATVLYNEWRWIYKHSNLFYCESIGRIVWR